MFEIKDERKNIDNIDNMIFDFLVRRLDSVIKIGEIKSKNKSMSWFYFCINGDYCIWVANSSNK